MKESSIDLCSSCRFGTSVSGFGRIKKYCGILMDSDIDFPVESCSSFNPKGSLDIDELKQMAVYIEKKKDSPGFRFTKRDGNREVDFS